MPHNRPWSGSTGRSTRGGSCHSETRLREAWNANRQRVYLQRPYPGLNASWFFSLTEARERTEARRIDYNTERPHSGPGSLDAQGLRSASSPSLKNLVIGPNFGARLEGSCSGDGQPRTH